VRSSFDDSEGTWVTEEDAEMEKAVVSAVTCNTKEAKVTIAGIKDEPGVAAQIFTQLGDANVVVDMIVQNLSAQGITDITFTVEEASLAKTLELCRKFKETLGATQVSGSDDIAKVSIIGAGMRSHSGVAAKMFKTLANEGINIEMISTSEIKVSCIIRKKYAELAVRALHETFGLDAAPAS
jgi:aspartate kinase